MTGWCGAEYGTTLRVNGQGELDERGTSVVASKVPLLMSIAFYDQKNCTCCWTAELCFHLTPSEQTLNSGNNTLRDPNGQMPTQSLIFVQFDSVDESVSKKQIWVNKVVFNIFQNSQPPRSPLTERFYIHLRGEEGVSEPIVAHIHHIFVKSWNKTFSLKCNIKMLTKEIMDQMVKKTTVPQKQQRITHQSKQLMTLGLCGGTETTESTVQSAMYTEETTTHNNAPTPERKPPKTTRIRSGSSCTRTG